MPVAPDVPGSAERVSSIDILRGIVMVVMALDHVRDFVHRDAFLFDPADLTQTTPFLFLTRWITHFCAPVFVFLAGTGIFLSLSRGKSKRSMSWFLATRGFWLIVLEFTIVRFGWTFHFDYTRDLWVQVIWVFGVSMIIHAALIHLSLRALAVFGFAMVLFHNAFDTVTPEHLGPWGTFWSILHVQTVVDLFGLRDFFIIYPLIPWIGVMSLGYCFGAIITMDSRRRTAMTIRIGAAATAAFFALRFANVYGDPQPWTQQRDVIYTVLSFFNVEKYPPSLLYVLMTLGPSILLLPLLERWSDARARALTIFGRVPMFYYILHIPLAHGIAALLSFNQYGMDVFSFGIFNVPPGYGYDLWVVYVVWIAVVLMLYPACRWYAGVRKRNAHFLFSYL